MHLLRGKLEYVGHAVCLNANHSPADVQDNHDSKLAVFHPGQPELNAHVDLWYDDAA